MSDSSATWPFEWPGFFCDFCSPLAEVDPESGLAFPRQSYDPEARAGYWHLRPGQVAFTKRFNPNLLADYDSSGNLLGVEVLDFVCPDDPLTLDARWVAGNLMAPVLSWLTLEGMVQADPKGTAAKLLSLVGQKKPVDRAT